LHFLPVPVGLADPEGVDTYAFGMLLNHFKPVLCIIDTQARVTVGAEENSSTDMGKFVDSLEHLRACPKQKDVPEPEDIELTLYPIDNSAMQ
jgi:hypothetical protein